MRRSNAHEPVRAMQEAVCGLRTRRPAVLLPAALAAALTAGAVTLDVPRLPAPAFADREVSGDAALPAGRTADLRTFRLELTFDATPSNNVQVAFAFPGLALTPFPGWLKPDLWTCLRVTARGVSAANENVSAKFLPDGARIVIR